MSGCGKVHQGGGFQGASTPPSEPAALQQPVPQEFYADDGGENAYLDLGPMYLVWLHRHMESIRKQFLEQISSAIHKLNEATWPSDVGLSSEEFHFTIWRGAARAMMTTKETRYPGELVAYSDRAKK